MYASRALWLIGLVLLFSTSTFGWSGDDCDGDGGPCKGGYWPDDDGCCPSVMSGIAHYRDENQCYPRSHGLRVYYADCEGCYPDWKGRYLPWGETCPSDRKCEKRCIRPGDDDHPGSKQTCPPPKHKTCPPKTCPPKTCPPKTTTEHQTNPPATTTTHSYTTQKPSGNWDGNCGGGYWADKDKCCPRAVGTNFFYRDWHGCYPIWTIKGPLYADGTGCYPDIKGEYLKAGESCPADRKCPVACDGEPSW